MKKVALVTGGARGIGRTICLKLASIGFDIVCNYNQSKVYAQSLKKEIESMNAKCLICKCDVSNESEVKNMLDEIINYYGKVDVLVNNAGISIDTLFSDKTVENFKKTLEVNLIGTFLVSKYCGEIMYKNKYGKIVNIASTNGINTYFPMCCDYDASKAGIISLTHNLAMQFAPYINVNAIAPGFIKTENEIKDMDEEFIKMEEEKIFLKRAGTEEDVANLVKFLVSDESSFINSEVIRIDGGMYGS